MTFEKPPLPPPPAPPRKPGSTIVFVVWACVGLVFALIQFGLSEAFHQMANFGAPGELYELSNAITWPAGVLYDAAESRHMRRELEAFAADTGHDPELRENARELLAMDDHESFWDAAWDFADTTGIDAGLDIHLEYLIYGGVCLGWGALIAVAGSVFSLVLRVGATDPP